MTSQNALRIDIGVATRNRPEMLRAALGSLVALEPPKGAELGFIVVENAPSLSVGEIVAAFAARVGEDRVRTALEPRPGIPFARNRVLDLALSNGARYLAFIDDDETVHPDWLSKLVAAAEARELDLAGGPLEVVGPARGLTAGEAAVLAHLRRKVGRRRADADALAAAGREGEVRIFTNNWLCRLEFVRRSGLRFDEGLGLSSGSDLKFYLDLKRLGGRSGWVSEAPVRDHIPPNRLTVAYQYRRAHDQIMMAAVLGGKVGRRHERLRASLYALPRAIQGWALIAAAPVAGSAVGPALRLRGTLQLAAAAGRIGAAWGRRHRHYDDEAAQHASHKGEGAGG